MRFRTIATAFLLTAAASVAACGSRVSLGAEGSMGPGGSISLTVEPPDDPEPGKATVDGLDTVNGGPHQYEITFDDGHGNKVGGSHTGSTAGGTISAPIPDGATHMTVTLSSGTGSAFGPGTPLTRGVFLDDYEVIRLPLGVDVDVSHYWVGTYSSSHEDAWADAWMLFQNAGKMPLGFIDGVRNMVKSEVGFGGLTVAAFQHSNPIDSFDLSVNAWNADYDDTIKGGVNGWSWVSTVVPWSEMNLALNPGDTAQNYVLVNVDGVWQMNVSIETTNE